MTKTSLLSCLLLVGACARGAVPVEAPPVKRLRPDWTSQLTLQMEAIHACLELRAVPRYVVFLDPLPSGATGVTTIDAYGDVEHCAHLDGEVVRREPTHMSGTEIAEAGGVLFSLGPVMPAAEVGVVLEEVVEEDAVVGWLYWPKTPEANEEDDNARY